ncbi:hypothetical protein [Niveibacterium sp.]|uniref:hypothetical protein n=1 Tax=Niveibacterium sp. TaxID=2017444 RepID=UPI0035B0E74C
MSSRWRWTTSSESQRQGTRRWAAFALVVAIICARPESACGSEIAIVVRADSALTSLTRDEAYAMFVLDQRRDYITYDLPDTDPAREVFYLHLAGKNLAMMRGLRARLVFSGLAKPPRQLNAAELIHILQQDPKAIGYLPTDLVPPGVRVLLPLGAVP